MVRTVLMEKSSWVPSAKAICPESFPGASPGNCPFTRGMAFICWVREKRSSRPVISTAGQQGSSMVRREDAGGAPAHYRLLVVNLHHLPGGEGPPQDKKAGGAHNQQVEGQKDPAPQGGRHKTLLYLFKSSGPWCRTSPEAAGGPGSREPPACRSQGWKGPQYPRPGRS